MKQIIQIVLSVTILTLSSYAQDCARCHTPAELASLTKSSGIFQKAVGVMDKGQIQNNTGNFGTLSSFHVYFTNALHWPASADYVRQYSFGLGIMLGVNENDVIETETQSQSKIIDWLPPDDARGLEFSGDIAAESDDTPFMASSDLLQSWPDLGWPGYFRVDVNSLTDAQLAAHPEALTLPAAANQFSSDRDIFCSYNDAQNSQGSHGLTIEQTAHSYGRPYAEDIVFWDFKVFNEGSADLDSIYLGFYAKFRPDFDNHDYVNFIDSDGDNIKDLVYIYDVDNINSGAWAGTNDPMGIVGLRIFDTPGQIGVTDFHHFSREAAPKTDQELWALMSSKQNSDYLLNSAYYFHGDNPRIDNTHLDSLGAYYPAFSYSEEDPRIGGPVNYIVSCGPFDLKSDSMTTISIGLIMGDAGTVTDFPDTTDLMNNVRTAQEMYRLYFQGSGPPNPPTVHAVAGDGQVTLYWDAASESSRDVWTGDVDFEGYRIYRSTNAGLTWGDPITDVYGNRVGYHPVAQFDYTEEEDLAQFGFDVSGPDPAYPQNLGDNTGLAHTFVDSNLVNGVEYWYSVSAYDIGNPTDPGNLTPSYMNAPGQSWHEVHTVKATPGRIANDLNYGSLEALGGVCSGLVTVHVEDAEKLQDMGYIITFDRVETLVNNELIPGIAASVLSEAIGDTLVNKQLIIGGSDENIISVDGLLIYLEGPPTGVESMGWTKVAGDTCTFDWRTESKYPSFVPTGQAFGDIVESFDDWRISVDYNAGIDAIWYDAFWGEYNDLTQHLPLKVEVVTDPANPVDVSENVILCDFNLYLADDNEARPWFYSPQGWDLVPGGKGYLPGSPGWYELHVDMLILEKIDVDLVTGDTIPNYLYLLTNNKPDVSINKDMETETIVAVAPSDGDEFTILTTKPFRPGITYRFNPLQQSETTDNQSTNSLDQLIVVPDPYIVTNAWETNEFGKRLMFSNLPSACTIKIYTLLGEHVDTVEHGGDGQTSQGYAFWDMRTRNEQFIAPGVYLYHAETPDGDETLGRFLVIK